MTTRRQQRVAEQVRHELSKMIEHEVDDPRLEMISLTDATISPDLHDANIYVSSLQGEAARDEVLAGLEAARGFLRHGLGQRLKLRVVPNLHFRWDKSLETGDRISRLIDQIEEADAQQSDALAGSSELPSEQ
jgi:ribosome-binding factor A